MFTLNFYIIIVLTNKSQTFKEIILEEIYRKIYTKYIYINFVKLFKFLLIKFC